MRILPLRGLAALAYLIGVLVLTTLPGREVSAWGVSDALLDLAHVPLFAGLTLVTLWAVVGPRVPRLLLVTASLIAFAAIDEGLQLLVPGRFASFGDVLRDVVGVGIGAAVFEGMRPLANARKKESHP
ncbi:MAG: VanZ family protein [Deltaproteobacteria bacterium]|nr:VanZ family protein [Deltaproteobacteria bacterium]